MESADETKFEKHVVEFGKMTHKLKDDGESVIHTGSIKITVAVPDEDVMRFWTYNREHKDLYGSIIVGPDDPQQTRLYELARASLKGLTFTTGKKSNSKELNKTSVTLNFAFPEGTDIPDMVEAFDKASGFLIVESVTAKNSKNKPEDGADVPLEWAATGLGNFNFTKPIQEKLLKFEIETIGDLQAWIRTGDKLTETQKKTVVSKMVAWFKNQKYKLPAEFKLAK